MIKNVSHDGETGGPNSIYTVEPEIDEINAPSLKEGNGRIRSTLIKIVPSPDTDIKYLNNAGIVNGTIVTDVIKYPDNKGRVLQLAVEDAGPNSVEKLRQTARDILTLLHAFDCQEEAFAILHPEDQKNRSRGAFGLG